MLVPLSKTFAEYQVRSRNPSSGMGDIRLFKNGETDPGCFWVPRTTGPLVHLAGLVFLLSSVSPLGRCHCLSVLDQDLESPAGAVLFETWSESDFSNFELLLL